MKTMFLFSDMEFDKASSHPWETDYMVIKRKYEENRYGNVVPEAPLKDAILYTFDTPLKAVIVK